MSSLTNWTKKLVVAFVLAGSAWAQSDPSCHSFPAATRSALLQSEAKVRPFHKFSASRAAVRGRVSSGYQLAAATQIRVLAATAYNQIGLFYADNPGPTSLRTVDTAAADRFLPSAQVLVTRIAAISLTGSSPQRKSGNAPG